MKDYTNIPAIKSLDIMEKKKLKLLFPGKKGILLRSAPETIEVLYTLIEHYYKIDPLQALLTFTDDEKDECEIVDDFTYQAACSEPQSRIIIRVFALSPSLTTRFASSLISPDRKSLKYFKKKSRKMVVFDIESETVEYVIFPVGILFREYAAWIELPNGEIFYCGGGHPVSSNEVYMLNPYTKSYKMLQNMTVSRHSHGITYSNGIIYVVGGTNNNFSSGNYLKSCEKYTLEDERWETLYDMEAARGDASAVAVNDNLLYFGKGSNYILGYNSNDFRVNLLEDQGGCMCAVDNLLYIFHGSKVKIIDILTREIIEEHKLLKKASWWSHCPPIAHLHFIYFIWWEEPGWACKYNRTSKEFSKIISL